MCATARFSRWFPILTQLTIRLLGLFSQPNGIFGIANHIGVHTDGAIYNAPPVDRLRRGHAKRDLCRRFADAYVTEVALYSRVVSVLDSGAEGPGSNRSRDVVG